MLRSSRVRHLLLGVAAVVLLGCGGQRISGPTVPVGRDFVLAPGEVADVEDAGLRLRFVGVLGDSRCPADAVCILGGDAVVAIAVTAGHSQRRYELHTGNGRSIVHAGLTIVLIELVPYPFSAQPIDPAAYRATLRVTR